LDGLLKISGVADHVWVCEVDDEDIGLAFLDGAQYFVCDFEGRHLRHQIVCGDLRRRHEQAALGRKFFFGAAVEEVCDVRVLLRSEEHTSELQSQSNLVCRLLLEKKKK